MNPADTETCKVVTRFPLIPTSHLHLELGLHVEGRSLGEVANLGMVKVNIHYA